ncbi:OmpA family protein [Fulvivirga sp.]|jgi:outer membrane protein OmpA-like peptidoglycan-associated protein|uniref:OmpA family protein n=1 Tax=Fulvivirga sp. TaxID=1931237 RepID=UPI0032EC8EAB
MYYRRFALHAIIFLLVTFFASSCASGQRKTKSAHQRNNRAYYKKRYASSTKPANTQCFQLFKKKTNYKNRKVIASKNKGWESRPMAEVDYNETPSKPAPKPKPQPVASTDTKPDIDKMDLDEKHNVEDEVLKKNNLPAPTSAKHEQIRKEVEKKLENFENEKPIKLEPLYFVTGQDEFAFVDMDPFLVAVEYALQGKIILIEGHTDHVGDFKANVALSIKRVERIRELMIQMGVHDDHISVVGYGEEHSEEAQASDKKQNERRVDFTVF